MNLYWFFSIVILLKLMINTNITSAPDKLFVTWLAAKNVHYNDGHGLN